MVQKKLQRFAEIETFPNVLIYPENMQGNWNGFFKNNNPLTLELACGKGEYAVGLGRLYANRNFIGIDLKGNRIWVGAKTALEEGLGNVAFIRSHIDKVTNYFAKDEVDEIWITFPDPQLRNSKMKKRLTHPRYLRLYQQFLKPEGIVHLKTDSPNLYFFTRMIIDLYGLALVEDNDNVYGSASIPQDLTIQTHYEKMDIAGKNTVHHIAFKLNKPLPVEKETALKEKFIEENDHLT
ncbi:tRNA (guanosine(46)-N7)-methyltransferase TrmB [Haoranjiania flava]|uniref:tRNA (guanine(46)-N(7))-methyltransferase n=1 Tax=Haoranjiania flava TaxID=1856322 RepID=A0AAE3IM09_9BACT|nr:tRNA (guanosine(46)-N7)-methyltransferase TrmB [Haoranjiania flava]MCU7693486.1 tRNA (guanosine(46)-N7)-methyltransferase TrmB [Haoranjiania flava]